MAEPKSLTLAETLAVMRSKDKLEIGPLSDFHMQAVGLSTGNIALDQLTGVGGYPQGGIIEQFGPPSSGKTTAALQSMGLLQQRIKAGELTGYVMFLDYEKSLDELYCQALGLDTKDETFIYLQPTSFEHGANIYRRLLDTGELRMAVFDSVASMVTENELKAATGAAKVADRAKMMHQFLRQVNGPVNVHKTVLLFLNHTMDLVDVTPMGQQMAAKGIKRQTQPGGTALGFYSALRISFKQTGNLKSTVMDTLSNEKVAQVRQMKVKATVVKNKVGEPFGTAVLRIRWGVGFSQAYSVLDILVAYKAVKLAAGGMYTFPPELAPIPKAGPSVVTSSPPGLMSAAIEKKKAEGTKFKGEDTVIHAIESDSLWLKKLELVALDLLKEHGVQKVDANLYDDMGNEVVDEGLLDADTVDEMTGEVL